MKHTTLKLIMCLFPFWANAQELRFTKNANSSQQSYCKGQSALFTGNSMGQNLVKLQVKKTDSWASIQVLTTKDTTYQIKVDNLVESAIYRFMIYNEKDSLSSAEIPISVTSPKFLLEPQNASACNSSNIQLVSQGVGNFQWQISSDNGNTFQNLSETTKYKNVNSSTLSIIGLINSHHNTIYRALLTDTNSCTTISQNAHVSVHQISTNLNPNTNLTYCEGESLELFPASIIGEVISYQWQSRKSSQTNYSNISESSNYIGTQTPKLKVNQLLSEENNFRIQVTYKSFTQNTLGVLEEGTCKLESIRTNYSITPKPKIPEAISDQFSCGATSFLLESNTKVDWYLDTLSAPLLQNQEKFQTPQIAESRFVFFNTNNNCKSNFQKVHLVINEKPFLKIETPNAICPSEENFNLKLETNGDLITITNNNITETLTPKNEIVINYNPNNNLYKIQAQKNNCLSDVIDFKVEKTEPPTLTISANKTEICTDEELVLTPEIVGGAGKCDIIWQINKISAAVTNPNWKDLGNSSQLHFKNTGFTSDSTFHFRAKIVCELSSCNTFTSNSTSIKFLKKSNFDVNFTDSTITKGTKIELVTQNCNGQILWSSGETSSKISIIPTENQVYSVSCKTACEEITKTINITILEASNFTISAEKVQFCKGEKVILKSENCNENIVWSNGMNGSEIGFSFSENIEIYATCGNIKSNTVSLSSKNISIPGKIEEVSGTFCAGYNPAEIKNIQSPNSANRQWQISQDCQNWTDISGANLLTFNPPALEITTCYRRKSWNECDTSYSNIVKFDINPDPTLTISANKTEICTDEELILTPEIVGGAGKCDITWQINKTSAAVSNPNWKDFGNSPELRYLNSNFTNDSTFHFRAKISCEISSCNTFTSNSVSIKFLKKSNFDVNFTDSTTTKGTKIELVAQNCNGQILWSSGETTSKISVNPTDNQVYSVSCKTVCEEITKTINITILEVSSFKISTEKVQFCKGEKVILKAETCSENIVWSNGMNGSEIEFSFTENIEIFATCGNIKSNTVSLSSKNISIPGKIEEVSGTFCAGYNPAEIKNIQSPNSSNRQWQISQDCQNWTDISGANLLTFNPPALEITTCYRRKSWNECDTSYSNIVKFEINPDPTLTISANKTEICADQELILTPEIVGGAGKCDITWQINKTSAAVSNPNCKDLGISSQLHFKNTGFTNDSTFHFRAKIVCELSSCNTFTSNSTSIKFLKKSNFDVNFTDSTITKGSKIELVAQNCNGQILWSSGETSSKISVIPTENQVYSVSCKTACEEITKTINITILETSNFTISAEKVQFCKGEKIILKAETCSENIAWSNGMSGSEIQFPFTENLEIFATCGNIKSNTVSLSSKNISIPGKIEEVSGTFCAGYNPAEIKNIQSPNSNNRQWQISQDCQNWTDISGANLLTFNPPALEITTCYRRKSWNECDTSYSNIVKFEINPDPTLTISANKTEICTDEELILTPEIVGGAGKCDITWQINKTSAAVSNPNWKDLGISSQLHFKNTGFTNDSTFHFRAKIVCELSSCNTFTSNSTSIKFLKKPNFDINFTDSTITKGTKIELVTQNCNGQILWSLGETTPKISIIPTENQVYSVSCKTTCEEITKTINITILEVSNFTISVEKVQFCKGEKVILKAENCNENIVWSNGMSGSEIEFSFSENIEIYATCGNLKSNTVSLSSKNISIPGKIEEVSGTFCVGYNPAEIKNIQSPNSTNRQWQISENCQNWTDISGANLLTFNPPALEITTCYRRKSWNECDTSYSNIVKFEINPDPTLTISANKTEICTDEELILTPEIVGGAGKCDVIWQINKVSAAVTNSNWKDFGNSSQLHFKNTGFTNDSTFHFRAKIVCELSSCNTFTSKTTSIKFNGNAGFNINTSDTTVLKNSKLDLIISNCSGQTLWSTGEISPKISIYPSETQVYSVSCQTLCNLEEKEISVQVYDQDDFRIYTNKSGFCDKEFVSLSSDNCSSEVSWSNGMQGEEIEFLITKNIEIYAICGKIKSNILKLVVNPSSKAGKINDVSGTFCEGFNSTSISNIESPNSSYRQWQMSENCSENIWLDIANATGLTFNPPALEITTCYRRKSWNECDTSYSNIVKFEINPDPTLTISTNKTEICTDEELILTPEISGGAGKCDVTWQINKVSAAVTNPNWKDLGISSQLKYKNTGFTNDSTFHFRAKISCDKTSCNTYTSKVSSIKFSGLFKTNIQDTTVCAGSTLVISTSNCSGSILWHDGSTKPSITIKPNVDQTYSVTCSGLCFTTTKTGKISILKGIEQPGNTTQSLVFKPDTLIFSALGNNLKWYDKPEATKALSQVPKITKAGTYTYYVSQNINGCESPRLAISATLSAKLFIISQTESMKNCYGNVSTLSIKAEGKGIIKYQWQRKLPNETEFTNIENNSHLSNQNSASLRIASTGNLQSPNGTWFRCIISDELETTISKEILLTANRIEGNLPNITLCEGNTLNLDLNETHKISGEINEISWQHRSGTGFSWINLKDTGQISGSNSLNFSIKNLQKIEQEQFRISIKFISSSGTCTETSDLMTLKVAETPNAPSLLEQEICQGQKISKFPVSLPKDQSIIWLLNNEELKTQPTPTYTDAGNFTFSYSLVNAGKCKSDWQKVNIKVNPTPTPPLNTTSAQSVEKITFSAEGENLKWYRTKTLKEFETLAPIFNTVGKKQYYVTQTNSSGCESERLLIQSEVLAAFSISTQPSSQSNCDGNSVTFSLKTKGSENIKYQWQILKDNVYIDLEDKTSSDLRISDIGKSPYLHQSRYRCLVKNTDTTLISDTVQLIINGVLPKFPSLSICENERIDLSTYLDSLAGKVGKIEWQQKSLSNYSTVLESQTTSSISHSLESNTYRLRVTFVNANNSTCVRNSNDIKLTVNPKASLPLSVNWCENETYKDFKLKNKISLLLPDSTELESSFVLKNEESFLAFSNNNWGCKSELNTLKPQKQTHPKLSNLDSTLTFCRYTENIDFLKIQNFETYWLTNSKDSIGTLNHVNIDLEKSYSDTYFFKIKDSNSCYSDLNSINIEIQNCYLSGQLDTCTNVSMSNLMPNEWNAIYTENAEIYAEIHPLNQNLERLQVTHISTSENIFEDLYLNKFYPREWQFVSSKTIFKPYQARIYMSKNEILHFQNSINEPVNLLDKNVNKF